MRGSVHAIVVVFHLTTGRDCDMMVSRTVRGFPSFPEREEKSKDAGVFH